MNPLRVLLAAACASGSMTAALLPTAGCATPPATAEKIAAVPMGTVTTYHRKSSGSLGDFDGKVVWTHAPATWQGEAVIAFGAPQAGISLHETVHFGMLATLDAEGRPQVSFDPPFNFPWPLEVGKTWRTAYRVTMHASGRSGTSTITGRVESLERVTVPAGTFEAYKVVWSNDLGESETRWISPDHGIATVKRHVERSASHPQGAGVLDAELLSRVVPTK